MLTPEQVHFFRERGYLVVENVVSPTEVQVLREALGTLERDGDRKDVALSWSGEYLSLIRDVPRRRGPLARLLQHPRLLGLVEQLVGGRVRVTGGLMMDKPPGGDWEIGWHQDSGIYVAQIPPGEPEDIRGGIPVLRTKGLELRRNVSARVALDPATAETGALYVVPGSHRENLGKGDHVKERFASEKGVIAHQLAGSVLFYCPLTLHRSEKMTAPGRRRILHLQYGPLDLTLPGAELFPWTQPCPLTPLAGLVE
ncbi:MAG: phytanoyl-CoA dioxygenase family protein [Planctomycetes bacterium]|nr:phytanoyl-CoA dioxygenase family protein [Planctomycetota bacterium]